MKLCQDLRTMLRVVLVLLCFELSAQVPAGPMDRFWEEMANVKAVMSSISTELERFNTLYLGKLESRMVSMATLLGNLDSNVKNLQERAHVWDTFQLHVAAWNEQINTLDKKVDILSRGQEKMVLMDSKVSSLVNLDYKVERLVRKMDETDNKLAVISKALDNQRDDPLFGEFATRGILSTLKTIERKIDHMEGSVSHSQNKLSRKRNESGFSDSIEGGEETVAGNGKLVIKCNTPVIVEELLRDVASKVDVMFDKMGQEDRLDVMNEEQLSDEQMSMEQQRLDSAEVELVDRLMKRMSAPNKKTARALESMEKSLQYVQNTTTALWKDQTSMLDQILSCCVKTEEKLHALGNSADSSLKRVEYALTSRAVTGVTLARQFHEQTVHLEGVFKRSARGGECGVSETPPASDADADDDEDVSVTETPVWEDPPMTSTHTACEKLVGTQAKSGVYKMDASTRYCEMGVDGGGWTVIQRRGDFPGRRQDFSLSWERYKHGFGDQRKEFWIGNDILHTLTAEHNVTLRIDLEDFNGNTAWAQYSTFKVGPETDKYRLRVAGYSGNATDSFSSHDANVFSTVDRKNDDAPDCCPCAPTYGGGWWFNRCFEANLNGVYYTRNQTRELFRGVIWEHWLGNVSLRGTRMMVRPRDIAGNDGMYQDFEVITTPTNQEDVDPLEIPEDP